MWDACTSPRAFCTRYVLSGLTLSIKCTEDAPGTKRAWLILISTYYLIVFRSRQWSVIWKTRYGRRMRRTRWRKIFEWRVFYLHFKKYLQVASTRLTNRHQRPNIELCRDEPAHRLIEEVTELETTVQQLENKVGGQIELQMGLREVSRCPEKAATRAFSFFECLLATSAFTIKLSRYYANQTSKHS